MVQCKYCHISLSDGESFCPTCGHPLAVQSDAGTLLSDPDGSTATSSGGSSQALKSKEPPLPIGPEMSSVSLGRQKSVDYDSSQTSGYESNPYYQVSPYPTPPPPPPRPTRKRKNTVASVVVLLALVTAGVFIFVVKANPSGVLGGGRATATQQNQSPSPSGEQALYDQTIVTTPVMNDPLSGPDNFGLDNYTGQGSNTICSFSQGALHSSAQPGYFSPCYAKATNYQNFVLQVKMTIISGHSGGLVFRADSTNDKGYQFRISTDGTYILNRIILDAQGRPQSDGETLTSASSTLVQQGANQTNQLAVIAHGNTISLFINGKYVVSVTDSTYQSGQVGIYVDSDAGSVEGVFNNLQVWKLS